MAHVVCRLGEQSTSKLLSLNDDIHTRPLSGIFHLLGPGQHPSCVLVFPLSRRIHKTRRQARSPPEAKSRIRLGSTIRSMAKQHLCTTMHFGLAYAAEWEIWGTQSTWRRPASYQRYNKTMNTAGGALRSRATQSSLYSTGWRAREQAKDTSPPLARVE